MYVCIHTASRHQTHVSEDGDEISVEVNSLIESKQNGFIDPGNKKKGQGRGRGGEEEKGEGVF